MKKYKSSYKVPTIARIDITLCLDNKSGNNRWKESIKLELDNLWKWGVFEVITLTPAIRQSLQFVKLLMIFDVKVDGRHKS